MCAIMGFSTKKLDKSEIPAYSDRTVSRGPDMSRIMDTGSGWLCFHRLAIMGLTEAGMQPFELDGDMVVCNGELYGFRPLKRQLTEKAIILIFVRKCHTHIKACNCITIVIFLALFHIINSLVIGSQCKLTIYKITAPCLITVISVISRRADINRRDCRIYFICEHNTCGCLALGSHHILDICCIVCRCLHFYHIRLRCFCHSRCHRCFHFLLRCHRTLLTASGRKHTCRKNSCKNQITFFHYISSI